MTKPAPKRPPHGLPPTARSLPISLIRARESVMGPIRAMLHDTGLTEQQWRILRVLSEHGDTDIGSLSERAGLLPPSATRIVQSMTQKDIISRRTDPGDRRRQVVSLLPKGQAILDQNFEQAKAIAQGFRGQLGDADYEQLLDLLDKLISD